MSAKLTATLNRLPRSLRIAGLVALALAILGLFLDPPQFWRAYLLAHTFWLQIGLGCLGMVMLHHLVGGRWSARILRLMETGAMTLPLMAVLFVPLLLGLTTLYPWANSELVAHSELLQAKTAYLNIPFFLVRAAIYFGVWLALAYFLNRWSLERDRTGAPYLSARMRRLSAAGMILYVLTATFAAFDWMMSLEPEWFSSAYGLLWIAGQATAALALAILGLRYLIKEEALPNPDDSGGLSAGLDSPHRVQAVNDLGNFLLGFVMIWAYLAFSQFLIIWSADIPEEGVWYAHRSQGGWLEVGLVLIALHFALPFLVLLSRRAKRSLQWLAVLAGVIVFARLTDMVWLIVPAFHPTGVYFHWLDLVLLIAVGAGWAAMFLAQWTGKAPLPRHDPRLAAHTETPVEGEVATQ
jgi:hypothetical protein